MIKSQVLGCFNGSGGIKWNENKQAMYLKLKLNACYRFNHPKTRFGDKVSAYSRDVMKRKSRKTKTQCVMLFRMERPEKSQERRFEIQKTSNKLNFSKLNAYLF